MLHLNSCKIVIFYTQAEFHLVFLVSFRVLSFVSFKFYQRTGAQTSPTMSVWTYITTHRPGSQSYTTCSDQRSRNSAGGDERPQKVVRTFPRDTTLTTLQQSSRSTQLPVTITAVSYEVTGELRGYSY